jgi:hypothetical protein
MKTVEEAVLECIRIEPKTSQQVREYLASKGYKNNAVRTAIASLWDSGKLNVGLDQLLHPNP